MRDWSGRQGLVRALIGVLVALGGVRLYHEFILRNSHLRDWFSEQFVWRFLLLLLAMSVSWCVAVLAKRRLGSGLVIPLAMVAGALTTAVHTSFTGMVVGLLVGVLVVWDALRRILFRTVRTSLRATVPYVLIGALAGVLGQFIRLHGVAGANTGSQWIYLIAVALLVVMAMLRANRPKRGAPAARNEPRRSVMPRVLGNVWQLSLAAICLGPGIWIGWQADAWWRIRAINRVGYVACHPPANLREAIVEGLFVPHEVYLNNDATNRHLKILNGHVANVAYLVIESPHITNQGMPLVQTMRSLRSINISGAPIGDEGFRYLTGLAWLEHIYVDHTKITGDSFVVLSTLPRLNFVRCSDVADAGRCLEGLVLAKGLRWVDLDNCGITDADLEAFANPSLLSFLRLQNNKIKGPGLVHLAAQSRLATLDLHGNPLDDQYLVLLEKVPLTGLSISRVELSLEGCRAICCLRGLQSVSLRECRLTDEQLRMIRAATSIQDATLDGALLTAKGLHDWRQRDVTVYVEHMAVAASDIQRLAALGPDVILYDCTFDAGAVAEFANQRRVFTLHNCHTQSRFEAALARYAIVRRTVER